MLVILMRAIKTSQKHHCYNENTSSRVTKRFNRIRYTYCTISKLRIKYCTLVFRHYQNLAHILFNFFNQVFHSPNNPCLLWNDLLIQSSLSVYLPQPTYHTPERDCHPHFFKVLSRRADNVPDTWLKGQCISNSWRYDAERAAVLILRPTF